MASKHRSLTGYMKQRGNDAVNSSHEETNVLTLQRQATKQGSEDILRRKQEEEIKQAEKLQRDQQDVQRPNLVTTNRDYGVSSFDSKARTTTANTPRQRRGEGLRVQPPKTLLERNISTADKVESAKWSTSMAPVMPSNGVDILPVKQDHPQGRPFYETDTDHMDDTTTLSHDGESKEIEPLEHKAESAHLFPSSHLDWKDPAPPYRHEDSLKNRGFPQSQHTQFYDQPPASSSIGGDKDGEEYSERTDDHTEEGETDDEGSSEGIPQEDNPTLDTTTLQAMQREAELVRRAKEHHVTYRWSPSMQLSPSPPSLPVRAPTHLRTQTSISLRETTKVPSPLPSDPPTTPQISQPATKRSISLDYTPAELANMPYATLASESFDHDPQAPPNHPHTPPVAPAAAATATSLADSLLHLSSPSTSSQERITFFSTLPIADYEEAGDLLLSRFSETIQKFKNARRERRRIAGEFEEEIARREERVRGRVGGIEKEVGRLRRAGEDVVRGNGNGV